jgi:heptosyltransferase I
METKSLRVLVVRLGAMGDILHALPALTALRAAHPEWVIGWAVEPHWSPLLVAGSGGGLDSAESLKPMSQVRDMGHPDLRGDSESRRGPAMPVVDRVHLVGAKGWGRAPFRRETWADILRVRRELFASRYDVCLDLQGAVRSAVVGRWAGAARMIGEDDPREGAARWLFGERVKTRGEHVIEQCLEVAGAVAGEVLPFRAAELPRDSAAEVWCEGWLSDALGGRPFVMLNPGAGWGAKRWPAERYGRVAAAFATMGYGVVVNAGPGERGLAAEVVAASGIGVGGSGAAVVALTPSLAELISLSRRASLVVAGDTGPLHLANALGRPVVGIFGPTDPGRNGPFGSAFRVLRHPESVRDHSRRSDPEAGLLTISVEDVMAAAGELLGNALVRPGDFAGRPAGEVGGGAGGVTAAAGAVSDFKELS